MATRTKKTARTKKKATRAPATTTAKPLTGEAAVAALLKQKQGEPPGPGWLRGVVDAGGGILRKALAAADLGDVAAIERAIEERLVSERRVMRLPPNLSVQPEEVRITIPEVSRLFGLPERTIRDALISGLLGGHNFAGRTGWLTTVPEVRAYLRALEEPGLVTRLEARVAELEAAAKKAA